MLGLVDEHETLTVVDDQIGVPTWAGWLAEATATIGEQLLAAGDPSPLRGLYHLAGTGQTSWYGFARAIFAQFGRTDVTVEPVPYTALDSTRARTTFDLALPTWTAQLARFRERVGHSGVEVTSSGTS
jgi:dTDP-4-dehydrorhamnose reductase